MAPPDDGDGDGAWLTRYRLARRLMADEAEDGVRGVAGSLEHLCRGLAKHLSLRGAAVSLMSEAGSQGVAAASDHHIKGVDELQFTTGVGPCHDAFAARRPVLTADLDSGSGDPWPGYTSAAIDAGVRAVFSFPLHVGAVAFGVLDLYAEQPGPLNSKQVAMALTFAQIATETLLDGHLTSPGGDLEPILEVAMDSRAEIHQAQGMLMVSLQVGPTEALARMRAYAFAHDRPLIELAKEIIAGRDHLDDHK
ncbi:MAG: GAF and ANTAR domain-containing protein [Nocardioides sp.]